MAGTLAMGACGGDDSSDSGGDKGSGKTGPRYPYPAATVREFVDSCARDGSRQVCQCTVDRLQETLPFKEFDAADQAIRREQPIEAKTRDVINAATDSCRE